VLFDERAQQIHIIAHPELGNGGFISPGMLFEPCLSKEVVLRGCQLLLDLVKVDMQAELLTDLETDSGGRWRWA